jgi:hypothetical protein
VCKRVEKIYFFFFAVFFFAAGFFAAAFFFTGMNSSTSFPVLDRTTNYIKKIIGE